MPCVVSCTIITFPPVDLLLSNATLCLLLQLGHLRGMSVQVAPAPGEISKGSWLDTNVFTDIAFETDCGLASFEERHVYVTSISGAVYQVLCFTFCWAAHRMTTLLLRFNSCHNMHETGIAAGSLSLNI